MESKLKSELLAYRLKNAGIPATPGDAEILRRAEMKLRRLLTAEANGELSRDENSLELMRNGKPINDERNLNTRLNTVCKRLGTQFYVQSDCRGCSLYIGKDLTDRNYQNGVSCCI
jgi:hypothetical protein